MIHVIARSRFAGDVAISFLDREIALPSARNDIGVNL